LRNERRFSKTAEANIQGLDLAAFIVNAKQDTDLQSQIGKVDCCKHMTSIRFFSFLCHINSIKKSTSPYRASIAVPNYSIREKCARDFKLIKEWRKGNEP
jgi:hypothetical protein